MTKGSVSPLVRRLPVGRLGYVVRPAVETDLDSIAALCLEHAVFEKNPLPAPIDVLKLGHALFGQAPLLRALVACLSEAVIGYATYTFDFSTWRAEQYGHLDCLYVQAAHRRLGVGNLLMSRFAEQVRRSGCSVAEWQTPAWNRSAAGFYRALGATEFSKLRFVWRLS